MGSSANLSSLSVEDLGAVYDEMGLGEMKRQTIAQVVEIARRLEAWARAEVGVDA